MYYSDCLYYIHNRTKNQKEINKNSMTLTVSVSIQMITFLIYSIEINQGLRFYELLHYEIFLTMLCGCVFICSFLYLSNEVITKSFLCMLIFLQVLYFISKNSLFFYCFCFISLFCYIPYAIKLFFFDKK